MKFSGSCFSYRASAYVAPFDRASSTAKFTRSISAFLSGLTTTRRRSSRRSRSASRNPASESSMVLRGPHILDEAFAGRHQVDGMDHRTHLPQGLLDAGVID